MERAINMAMMLQTHFMAVLVRLWYRKLIVVQFYHYGPFT